MLRSVVAGNLEALGFTVIEAGSAAEARRCFAETTDIRAALIDVGLPDARGDLLAAELRQELADLPVILATGRSEEHTSELQSLMRISYAVFCLKKKTTYIHPTHTHNT